MTAPAFLADTSVLSEPSKPRADFELMRRLDLESERVATASVAALELLYGAERHPDGRKKRELLRVAERIIARFPILNFDLPAARWLATERVRLERIGRTPPFLDGQIAAIAAVNGLTVVTKNVADFEPFSIRVEDWSARLRA